MIINAGTKEMMSDSLRDQISEEEIFNFKDKLILCILTVVTNERTETVLCSLHSISQELKEFDNFLLEVKASTEDAFGIFESWKKIKINHFEIFLGENKIAYDGPFAIKGLKLFDIDLEKMISSLVFQLEKL